MTGAIVRRWLPAALIVGAATASVWARGRLAERVAVQFEGVLPFAGAATPETAARWLVLWLMPALALVAFALFRMAPTAGAQGFGRRLFPHAPAEVTSPAQFERFGSTYDVIVLAVVLVLVGAHAALLAAALQAPALAVRMLPAVLGVCLVLMGNVMPRLRPNWVAGLRARHLLDDPQLWRRTHRVFGAALVLSGIATIGAALVAPVHGVIVAVGSLVASCLIGWLASRRDGGTGRRASRAVLALVCATASDISAQAPAAARSLEDFGARLERLRIDGHIQAITAVIGKDQALVWTASLGGGDAAPVSDTTVFHLASLTKPLASTVILQLVEEGKVSLDDPVSKYGIVLASSGNVLVRHLLSHTSEGVPGSHYRYNGNRFSLLDSVIARAAGKSFAAAVHERIVVPLGLRHTAPTPQSAAFAVAGLDSATYVANVAPGYTWKGSRFVPTAYESSFSSAAGMTASALDYAAFSMAMDRDALLKPVTKALAYTPAVGPSGVAFPYGLGWFATDYKGVRVIWHYGYWTASSALIIKVPSQGMTFVLFANTDGLSAPYPLGAGRLEASPWAREFLERFVIAKQPVQ